MIGYLFIATAEIADRDRPARAISWDAIADLANQRAIVLNLGASEVLTSPFYSLAAPLRPARPTGDLA